MADYDKKYNNGVAVTGLSPTEASPLDDRLLYTNVSELIGNSGDMPDNVSAFYEDMVITLSKSGHKYIWVESDYGLLDIGYTYPDFLTDLYGVDYGGKTYNFILFNSISRIEKQYLDGASTGIFVENRWLPYGVLKSKDHASVVMKSSKTGFTEIEHPDHIEVVPEGINIILDPRPAINEIFKLTIS